MSQKILRVQDIKIYYHLLGQVIKAVDGVSFEVGEDEVFSLVGESGSGKTTLCMGLLGMIFPPGRIEQGKVFLGNRNLLELNTECYRMIRWCDIAYIPQGAMSSLNPVAKIRTHFFDTVADHKGRSKCKNLDARIEEILTKIHLSPDVLDKYPHELSGGMKQRVCIALSMILQPKLIIADEPTSALDVITQRRVLETMSSARKDLHASMILIGHDMALQAQIANRIGVMYKGKIVEMGNVNDIFNNPVHPYTKRLIASTPSIRVKQSIHELSKVGLEYADGFQSHASNKYIEVEPGHIVAEITS